MISDVTWVGFDYAFTLMNPLTMHHSKVIPELYATLGRGAEGPEKLRRWYALRDSMGNPGDAPHQKVRLLKEYDRGKMNSEVFDDDPQAIALYAEMETQERKPSEGVREALRSLKQSGRSLSVVSEVTSMSGAMSIVGFLRVHGLAPLFDELITPVGRLKPDGEMRQEAPFKGATKKDGLIYEKLREYLDSKEISAGQTAIVGDDPKLDVEQSKRFGFFTVQYTGVIDRGRSSQADMVIDRWSELARSP